MKSFFTLLIVIAILASCTKSTVSPLVITGTWELRNVSGGFNGINQAYASGNGMLLQFNTDSSYVKFTSSKRDTSGKYHIGKNSIDFAGRKYDGIYYNGVTSGSFIILKTDSLTIGDPFPDGITSIYIKQKN